MSADAPLINGRYRILEKRGMGAMGSVYRAIDETIRREVALKLISATLDPLLGLREAQSAGRLNHPNIVTIFDVGTTEAGDCFVAMEYVDGDTLDAFVTGRRTSTIVEQLQLLEQLCAGLDAAHREGVIHRDIKPSNLLVLRNQLLLKIVDFGIARASGLQTLVWGGTPGYMAPEQRDGRKPDARSDVYAATRVAYELIAGTRAFPDEQAAASDDAWARPSLARIVPDVGGTLDALVAKGTAVRADHRYQSARELGLAFRAIRREIEELRAIPTRVRTRPAAGDSAAAEEPARGSTRLFEQVVPPTPSRVRLVAAVGATVLVVALLGWLAIPRDRESPREIAGPLNGVAPGPSPSAAGDPAPNPAATSGRPPVQPAVDGGASRESPPNRAGELRAPVAQPENATPPPEVPPSAANVAESPVAGGRPENARARAPTASETAAIQDVLEAFSQAHRDRSSASLKLLQPSLTGGELAALDRMFAENESYDYRVLRPTIAIAVDRAVVTCLIERKLGVAGAEPRVSQRPATFDLRRDAEGRWYVHGYQTAP